MTKLLFAAGVIYVGIRIGQYLLQSVPGAEPEDDADDEAEDTDESIVDADARTRLKVWR